MNNLISYERRLPHRLPPGETLFLTFRLAGALPAAVMEQLRAERLALHEQDALAGISTPEQRYLRHRKHFGKFDALLDQGGFGPMWLEQPEIAAIVQQSLHYFHGRGYDLICYCIMPNHVHLVVTLPPETPLLIRTLQRLKSYTATQANALLQRKGQPFWFPESYDHIVRDGPELKRIISYVLENPVKAGLCQNWEQWPYSYLAE